MQIRRFRLQHLYRSWVFYVETCFSFGLFPQSTSVLDVKGMQPGQVTSQKTRLFNLCMTTSFTSKSVESEQLVLLLPSEKIISIYHQRQRRLADILDGRVPLWIQSLFFWRATTCSHQPLRKLPVVIAFPSHHLFFSSKHLFFHLRN